MLSYCDYGPKPSVNRWLGGQHNPFHCRAAKFYLTFCPVMTSARNLSVCQPVAGAGFTRLPLASDRTHESDTPH